MIAQVQVTDDRLAFGLHIQSDLVLPELTPGPGNSDRPRVLIRVDAVAPTLPGAIRVGPTAYVCPNDFLLDEPGVARYRVRGGEEIIVDPAPNASPRAVRLYLLGTAIAVLCYQRGLQPLHANAIVVNGRGLAFAGPPGSGKSTLAAYLHDRNYRVLCDDLCVLSFEADGRILAWPGLAQFKLRPDALSALSHDASALERASGDHGKYYVPSRQPGGIDSVPFHRLYVLARATFGEGGRICRLTGRAGLEALLLNVYRPRLLAPLGKRTAAVAHGVTLLKQGAVYSFERRWGFDAFAREVETLERHIHETAG
jgi:hypothetical protein